MGRRGSGDGRIEGGSLPARDDFRVIGTGSIGAKAAGLAAVKDLIETRVAPRFAPAVTVCVPRLTVIATGVFDSLLAERRIAEAVRSGGSDADIAAAFESVAPPPLLGAAFAEIAAREVPLAVRSSSVLEDRIDEPFAGVYETEMVAPRSTRTEHGQALAVAVARVMASTFFERARSHRRATGHPDADEKMSVILQEVAGTAFGTRWYPQVSGVARSCNFYPAGLARPEDGVAQIALGFGRAIVEEAAGWPFSPVAPHANPPYNEPRDLLERTQKTFWAIDMSPGPAPRGVRGGLAPFAISEAERDGALRLVASTYVSDDDRIVPGTTRPGPRVIDFAPILKSGAWPLAAIVRQVLDGCAETLGTGVEVEFAMTWNEPGGGAARFALLQVRPMSAAYPEVEVEVGEFDRAGVVAASTCALGNGAIGSIRDIVYVKPVRFDARDAAAIALQIEALNRALAGAGRPYLLIGFGRWGSTDASAGIPVTFAQISGARAIVETTLPTVNNMLSQGHHFFHNITSARVLYLSLGHTERCPVDWAWLNAQATVSETDYVRHVRLDSPLDVRVDGRTGRGVIRRE